MKKVLTVIFKILILLAIVSWVIVVCYDFFQVKKEKNPKFCIYETVHKYDDGETYECVGLGYKVYKYRRYTLTATEFGPIFISERQNAAGLK